ncbi:hypothetical protein DF947_10890 [Pedobacter paludis]|uniref:Uncharacterized protein n=1 Tax=Pedobacter paludis TaxID=2203212 RepID=A0A317F458_9SPHI|nr:hypothetical protein DF947_10890 [Pedobacter paludis]
MMRPIEPPFDLFIESKMVRVVEYVIGAKRVFRVDYNDSKKPLTITVAIGPNNKKFWTSIPEGRQAEAVQIGRLIADHIRDKQI